MTCCMKLLITKLLLLCCATLFAQPVHTEVKQNDQGEWTLYRAGVPYYVKGAGGSVFLKEVVAAGGNSIRTWGTENAKQVLDDAYKYGLTVMMGLWLQHERHGFDYDDSVAVARQKEAFRKDVIALKDHPALLAWGVGNEVDLNYSNTNVWYAVEDIAKMIKEIDPHHPTTTITAGLDSTNVNLIKLRCPSLDFYSINTYGDLDRLPDQIRRFGWDGPYMITEWGPNGHWEVKRTPWGAPLEQTSAQKAQSYYNRYYDKIMAERAYCMGSYVFLWGQKQETTSTWYGIFTEYNEKTETLWAIAQAWKDTKMPAPVSLVSFAQTHLLTRAHEPLEIRFEMLPASRQNIRMRYEIVPESQDIKAGGDVESRPESIRKRRVRKFEPGLLSIKAPEIEGAYRVFLYLEASGWVAYGNVSIYVQPQATGAGQRRFIQFETHQQLQ
jgi:hypothetical protein